jgi:hypothetical protein
VALPTGIPQTTASVEGKVSVPGLAGSEVQADTTMSRKLAWGAESKDAQQQSNTFYTIKPVSKGPPDS